MANILEKFLGLQKSGDTAKTNELAKIQSYDENFVLVPKSDKHPEYLVALGRILHDGKPVDTVRTAISKKESDIEFSTNLGKLPNTPLGGEIKDRLSHRVDGKFVTFNNKDEPNTMDLVYATRKPKDLINKERADRELENHAMTKDLVNPVLSASMRLGKPKDDLNYADIKELAKDVVDSNLGLRERISSKLTSSKYSPGLLDKDKK